MANNNDDRIIPDAVILAYRERVSHFKKAKIYLGKDNIPKSVEYLQKYLLAVSAYWGVDEKDLHPDLFKDEGHVAEQLLISYAYWDLAKAYDRSEQFIDESVRCLKQFVLFSIGYKFQYANSIMLRKYIRLNKAKNKKAFQESYEKIFVKAKGCFVASYAYSNSHPLVFELREFRDEILVHSFMGRKFISLYYSYSPSLVSYIEKIDRSYILKNFFFKPIIKVQVLLIRLYRKSFYDHKN